MIEIYKPRFDELWFKHSLMADEDTVLYNRAWGGTLPFRKTNGNNGIRLGLKALISIGTIAIYLIPKTRFLSERLLIVTRSKEIYTFAR